MYCCCRENGFVDILKVQCVSSYTACKVLNFILVFVLGQFVTRIMYKKIKNIDFALKLN